ncbi:RDD family protein [Lysobacter brunescens]|uniref:RDD family protein n=1 Tax=Lysobacter brunescens TaxID=262323 RepID=A0ABW2Y7C1_9GAMM
MQVDPQHNPYDAPSAPIEAQLPSERLAIENAGRWRRLFGFLIDYAASTILSAVIAVPYVMFLYWQGGDAALDALENQQNILLDYVLGLFATLLYYIVLEGWFGWTIGKLVTGTRVVNEKGARPTWKQVVGRTLGRFIPFEPFSLLFANDNDKRGWHDTLSKTHVVRRR